MTYMLCISISQTHSGFTLCVESTKESAKEHTDECETYKERNHMQFSQKKASSIYFSKNFSNGENYTPHQVIYRNNNPENWNAAINKFLSVFNLGDKLNHLLYKIITTRKKIKLMFPLISRLICECFADDIPIKLFYCQNNLRDYSYFYQYFKHEYEEEQYAAVIAIKDKLPLKLTQKIITFLGPELKRQMIASNNSIDADMMARLIFKK